MPTAIAASAAGSPEPGRSASGTDALAPLRNEVLFYEEVRVYMAKFDAEERRASGQPVPEEIQRLLAHLIADSTETGRRG